MRLDLYLTEHGFVSTRSRAKALIEAGSVRVNGKTVKKPAFDISTSLEYDISVDNGILPYVSRGGLKLEAALDDFEIDLNGLRCADIGASTGGFTDCMLHRGAKVVYAVDSGSGQLSPSLRGNSSVVSIEKFNAKMLTLDTVDGLPCSFAAADLSFISQTYVLRPIASILSAGSFYIGLIKPQFECGREAVGKGGIVRGRRNYRYAADRVFAAAADAGFDVTGFIVSPIKGGDGNTEFLMCAVRRKDDKSGKVSLTDTAIDEVIRRSER